MIYSSITSIGSLTVNAATGNTLLLDPARCSGLDGGAGRVNLEPAPGADGGFLYPPLLNPAIFIAGGLLRISTASYAADLATLDAAIKAEVEGSRTAAITVTWATGSASMFFYQQYESHAESGAMWCSFGLTDAALLG